MIDFLSIFDSLKSCRSIFFHNMGDELIIIGEFFTMLIIFREEVCGLCPALNTQHVHAISFRKLKIMLIQVFLGFLSLHLFFEMEGTLVFVVRCCLFLFEFSFFLF